MQFCVGGCGCNIARLILNDYDPASYPDLYVVAVNTDGALLQSHFNPHTEDDRVQLWLKEGHLRVLQLGNAGQGAGSKPEVGKKFVEEKLEEIQGLMTDMDTVQVICGAGGGTGGGASPTIVQQAINLKKPTLAIAIMPFLFEGRARLKKAIDLYEGLTSLTTTVTLYNEQILKQGKELTARQGFARANNEFIRPMLRVLREITQEVGDAINVDIEDWRTLLEKGNHAQFGYAEVNEQNQGKVDVLVEQILEHPLQFAQIVRASSNALFWFHGKWNMVEEIQPLIARIEDQMSAESEIESHLGIRETTDDDQKWVGVLFTASKMPSKSQIQEKIIPTSSEKNGGFLSSLRKSA